MIRKWKGLRPCRALACLLLAVCIAAAPARAAAETDAPNAAEAEASPGGAASAAGESSSADGFRAVLSGGGYTLLYKEETAEIAVLETARGRMWYSNPQDREQDTLASAEEKNSLASQLIVTYLDGQTLRTADSWSQSVSLSQHEARLEDGAFTVEYGFGQQEFSKDMLPAVISKKRMEEKVLAHLTEEESDDLLGRYDLYVLDDLDEAARKAILISYPSLAEHSIYVRGNFPDYVGESLYEHFQKAGYTLEDLQYDCDDNDVENTYKPPVTFRFTLVYRLTEDGFSVMLDVDKTAYEKSHPPLRVEVLPFFGAAGTERSGYLFVPDGSGALIRLNNGKTAENPFWARLFGRDRAVTQVETGVDSQPLLLPVFGLSTEQGSFFANIDEGYECAGIRADVSGKSNGYNIVGAFFDIMVSDKVSLNSNYIADTVFYSTAGSLFSGPISMSYHFAGAGAGYDELAVRYRAYLKSQGLLADAASGGGAPLWLELTGTAQVTKKFLGIPYQALTALTTYGEAKTILSELGVEGVPVRYSNAANGGLRQAYTGRVRMEGVLGGKAGLKSLRDIAEVSVALSVQTARRISQDDAARSLAKDSAKQYTYHPISRYFERRNMSLLLSPRALEKAVAGMRKSLAPQALDGLVLTDIGYELNSDFRTEAYQDRRAARLAAQGALKALRDGGTAVQADLGSYFSLADISRVWNLPTGSSGYAIEDESVPFYAMVVRGAADFCTEPVNTSPDATAALLDAASIGAYLQYSWVYRNAANVVSYAERYYDRDYRATLAQAQEAAARMEPLLAAVGPAELTGYKTLENGLVESRFSNGVRVYVNYGAAAREAAGREVPPRDFIFTVS